MRSRYLIATKNYKRAYCDLLNYLDQTPGDYVALCLIGILAAENYMAAESMKYFAKAIDISIYRGEAWVNMGMIFERLGRLDDARLAFETAQGLEFTRDIATEKVINLGNFPKTMIRFIYPEINLNEDN